MKSPQFHKAIRHESPSTDRLRMLSEKWSNLKTGLEKDRYEKKEAVDTHIARIESQLNQDKPNEELKFKTLKDHIVKLQDGIYQDKCERERFDEQKQKDLRGYEEILQAQLEDEKSNKRRVELQLLKQIEERFTTLSGNLSTSNGNHKDKTNKALQNISLQMSELKYTLEQETQTREESQNSLVEQIDNQINSFQDMISVERQVREETQKKIFNMIEDIHARLQTELRTEKVQRETTVDQLLRLLEDTCQANIKDSYKLDKVLGEGSFAVVRKGIRKQDNQEFAIKIIDKSSLESDDHLAIQSEVEIMSQIDHPNIVKLFEVYDEKTKLNLVMELMTGGELFDRIVEKETYNEKEAAEVIRPVVDAIRYCHSMGIVHRDLKPENLLYSTPEPDATIKITDFGVAKVLSDELMITACGTPGYVAPEILTGKGYDMCVDYWSIGVILYVLLCGYPPFYEETNEKLFEQIKSGKVDFSGTEWNKISNEAKDLIVNLLNIDPNKRFKADQISKHPWLTGEKASTKDLSEVTEKLREFNARRKLRRAQLMVLAATRLQRRFQQTL